MDKENELVGQAEDGSGSSRRRSSFGGKGILRAEEDSGDNTSPPAHGQAVLEQNVLSVQLNETANRIVKPKKQPRKSLGRRVSWNPKIHYRNIDEDADIEKLLYGSPAPQDKKFEMPDLSSLRRTSGQYDFQLSPGGALAKRLQDISYEEDLKPPADFEMPLDEAHSATRDNRDMLKLEEGIELETRRSEASSLVPPAALTAPKARNRKMPRDSIAVFFDSPTRTPQKRPFDLALKPRGSEESDSDVEMPDATEMMATAPEIGETEAEWPGYPPVNETEQDYDFENDDQSVDMSLVTEDVSTESEQMPRMDSMSNTPDDQIQSEKPAENANPGPRPRIAHVYDDTIAGFFPREDSVEVEQHSAAAAAEPEIDQSERILDSSDDEEVPIPAEFARQVGRADMYDDTIAGFFATAPPISEQNVDGGAGKTSNQTAEAQTPQTKPVAPIPSQNAGRLFTADENDDTIGMFFKGNDKPGKPAVDSSDEDMEVTMDITKCVGRGILKRPKQYDTASTVDSMMSATPTQQSLAHRRRSSLRSASKLSDASPMPSPMNSPVPPKRRTPLKPKRSKPITEIVSSPAPAVNDPPVPTETEEQPFPAPVPTDAEPQMDVGDNEVDADVDEDDTAFDNDMQLEDDLKNANLSMMDESIMEETQSIANVREFLQATAIYFQDNLSTSFRRETNAYLRTDPPEELDFYKAALLWSSELDTYEFGCKELKQYIDDVREDLRHIEAEAEANPPPIFFDVCDGTVQEHNELQRQLKATKSFTRTEAKEDWHIWRSNLLNNLSEYFALNLEHLRKDEKKIQRFAAKFADVQAQVQKANVAKRNQISDTRQRIQDEEKAVRDRLAALDLRQDEQKQQIAQMKVDCEKMRLMCEEEDAKEQALLQEKAALLRSIEGAESVCKDLMVFDPEEMAALRGEYKLLASMFPWTSTQVEADKHVLVYDNIVQVTLEKVAEGAYKVALSIADAKKPLQHLLPTADQETNPVVGAWSRAKIMQVLKVEEEILGVCKGGADMSRITTHVARVWNAVHRLWHEVELARDEFVVEYVDPSPTSTPYPSPSPNDASSTSPPSPPERRLSPLCVATTFFSRPMRTRFTITIGIAATGDASTSTPTVNELLSLGTKWAWNVEVAYGHVDKKHIDRVIEMVPDAPGMLRDAFRQLEGMGTGA